MKISINRPERRNAFTPLTGTSGPSPHMRCSALPARSSLTLLRARSHGDVLVLRRRSRRPGCGRGHPDGRGSGGLLQRRGPGRAREGRVRGHRSDPATECSRPADSGAAKRVSCSHAQCCDARWPAPVVAGNMPHATCSIPRPMVLPAQIRRMPKPVVAMVAGYAVGGGHILHMMCDLTICADNAVFGQTGPKVTSCFGTSRVVEVHRREQRPDGACACAARRWAASTLGTVAR